MKPMAKEEGEKLIGQRFHRLTIVGYVGVNRYGRIYNCKCDCGKDHRASLANLRKGTLKSCGCLRREPKKHGHCSYRRGCSAEYRIWVGMKRRCDNPNHRDYKNYGGRGIKVCERWKSFSAFFADMGPRPSNVHSIDRFPDKNGDYEPSNCRWATAKEQANNSRRNRRLFINGEEKNVVEWSEMTGVSQRLIVNRLSRGYSVDQAISRDRQAFDPQKHPKDSAGRFSKAKV